MGEKTLLFFCRSRRRGGSSDVQILRAVCCMGVRLLFDDWAGSHNGPGPDHFLRTMGGRRIRIPRNATWLLQAADHHTCQVFGVDLLETVKHSV